MGLGKRISELRKRQGMTQEQLAQHLGTTRQAISKWESDKSEPDVATLVRLGTLFNVSMDYLLLGKESTGYHQACSRREPIDNKKHWVIPFLFTFILGIAILLLLPLFASIYRTVAIGPTYVDVNNYLKEWPMLGMVFLGAFVTAIGTGGLIWIFWEKVKEIIRMFIDI